MMMKNDCYFDDDDDGDEKDTSSLSIASESVVE